MSQRPGVPGGVPAAGAYANDAIANANANADANANANANDKTNANVNAKCLMLNA